MGWSTSQDSVYIVVAQCRLINAGFHNVGAIDIHEKGINLCQLVLIQLKKKKEMSQVHLGCIRVGIIHKQVSRCHVEVEQPWFHSQIKPRVLNTYSFICGSLSLHKNCFCCFVDQPSEPAVMCTVVPVSFYYSLCVCV